MQHWTINRESLTWQSLAGRSVTVHGAELPQSIFLGGKRCFENNLQPITLKNMLCLVLWRVNNGSVETIKSFKSPFLKLNSNITDNMLKISKHTNLTESIKILQLNYTTFKRARIWMKSKVQIQNINIVFMLLCISNTKLWHY